MLTSNECNNNLVQALSLEYKIVSKMEDHNADDTVKVSFHTKGGAVIAKVNDSEIQYVVDYLDLNDTELKLLKIAIKSNFSLENEAFRIHSNHVVYSNDNGTLSIKRIAERQPEPNQNEKIDFLEAASNTVRIQFSAKLPLMAKYKDALCFVDRELESEYANLLQHTKHEYGTAIRISNDRIRIYNSEKGQGYQQLSVHNVNCYDNEEIVVIKVPEPYEEIVKNNIRETVTGEFSRYYIAKYQKDFVIHKADPILINSSKYDIRTEIYAEVNASKLIDMNVVWSSSESESDDLDDDPTYMVRVMRYQPKNDVVPPIPPRILEKNEDEKSVSESAAGEKGNNQLKMIKLESYNVPRNITSTERATKPSKQLLKSLKIENFEEKRLLIRTNQGRYIEGCKNMIYFQEAAESIFLERFTQPNVILTQHMEDVFYFPIEKTMIELSDAIDENIIDWLVLKEPRKNAKGGIEFYGQFYQKLNQRIYVKIFKESFKRLSKIIRKDEKKSFSVHFTVNRTSFQLQHLALDFVKKHNLFELLIKNPKYNENIVGNTKNVAKPQNGKKLSINLNREQLAAVANIVDGSNYPLPYILYGPPGTGKTSTLSAAIEEIIQTTDKNILVCAMSNAACDVIAERLVEVLDAKQIYRMYAASYNSCKLKPRIEMVSNFENCQFFYPSLTTLYKYRVLICTLVTAGCLTRSCADPNFKANHFGYVFIDECSSAHETMTLIPIAGVCTEKNKIHANIVLAGDPKQLNAISKSDWAAKLGHKISMLEHLCELNLYKRNAITGKFNETFITQLVKNYRSHSSILKIPNELFYENALQCKASTSITNWYLNSSILRSKQFPIIFKSVQGVCKKDSDFSLYNEEEANTVVQYLRQLLPKWPQRHPLKQITQSDIGVATPYRKQCKKIGQKCLRYQFNDITVGTAEVFQGQERPVMIVSTVRSNGKHLGFVNDPRRMNVIITRAKCLLIIIGDPHTLQLDRNWRRLLKYCMDNNSFIQGNKPFRI